MMVSYEDFFGGGKKKETKMKLKDVTEDEEAGLGNQVLYLVHLFSSIVLHFSFVKLYMRSN